MIIEEMTRSECLLTLERSRLGRLACARDNQPYVVPFFYAYRKPDPCLYGFTTPGQKVEWMRSNPLVCVELDEVEANDRWTSVVLFGRYEELPDNSELGAERLHAYELLREFAGWWETACASRSQHNPVQLLAPVFYRIHIDSISGRRAKPGG